MLAFWGTWEMASLKEGARGRPVVGLTAGGAESAMACDGDEEERMERVRVVFGAQVQYCTVQYRTF